VCGEHSRARQPLDPAGKLDQLVERAPRCLRTVHRGKHRYIDATGDCAALGAEQHASGRL
jgi:hypothetical protein